MRALLDTHAAVFLWEGRQEIFGQRAREVLETHTLLVSPLTRLELAYLREIGRLVVEPDQILGGLGSDCGVSLTRDGVAELVSRAMALTWTRDPFDRLLVATAQHLDAKLVTRDATIQAHFPGAVW